ncbi:MAG: CBS domain-containing protein, partial [Thermoanaerobaculia bacterium]
MGEQTSQHSHDAEGLRSFSKKLLTDLRAFETMLDDGVFESEVTRIGAEQEMFLIDADGRPAPLA